MEVSRTRRKRERAAIRTQQRSQTLTHSLTENVVLVVEVRRAEVRTRREARRERIGRHALPADGSHHTGQTGQRENAHEKRSLWGEQSHKERKIERWGGR